MTPVDEWSRSAPIRYAPLGATFQTKDRVSWFKRVEANFEGFFRGLRAPTDRRPGRAGQQARGA